MILIFSIRVSFVQEQNKNIANNFDNQNDSITTEMFKFKNKEKYDILTIPNEK